VKEKRDIIFILGASLVLVVLWVVFSIYHNLNASTISEPVAIDINPIKPTFQENVVTTLKNRQKITPLLNDAPSPSPSPTPVATQSSQVQLETSTSSAQESQ
jgi:hypothetical protein